MKEKCDERDQLDSHDRGFFGLPAGLFTRRRIAVVRAQDNNQIYVSLDPASAFIIDDRPMQGRAPWWSPDGQYLVFESNRSGIGYALYVARIGRDGAASRILQLTDPEEVFNAQHAKFSPDGKTICFCAQRTKGAPNAVGMMPFTPF